MTENYLIEQYRAAQDLPINHNYLPQQFADCAAILEDIQRLVREGGFTLGRDVEAFEAKVRGLTGAGHAIGVNSGTDALFLSLKALGIGPGDEVITTPFTFAATVGVIIASGARPVFADIGEDYNLDPSVLEAAITPNTRAIMPVHWAGTPCRLPAMMSVAEKHRLALVEDASQAIAAEIDGKAVGRFGAAGCFSLHPLKNLNAWGDGGFIVTDDDTLREQLMLLRNHGLSDRDTCLRYGYNSRLDALQAVVANHMLEKLEAITSERIANAARYDARLAGIPGITVPPRRPGVKSVFHLYVIGAERRDALQAFLIERGVDAKVHYPVPQHLQPAAAELEYKRGDFPVAEAACDSVLSLPVHEYITEEQIEAVTGWIAEFYA